MRSFLSVLSTLLLIALLAAGVYALDLYRHGHNDAAVWPALAALAAVVLWLTFLPAFIASWREHPNCGAIFLLTLFLGWTLLGWVAALVWACIRLRADAVSNPAMRSEPSLGPPYY
jgi:hypothetical protein